MSSLRQTIIIVGGGGGGTNAARQLSQLLNPAEHNLILITSRPHFVHLSGCIRASVTKEGDLAEKVMIPFDKLMVNGNGTVIHSDVVAILEDSENGGSVALSNGDSIHWDILILAPGSDWEGPLTIPTTKEETTQWFNDWQSKFTKARDILLVGGGAVAIEYAGEIKDLDPSKNVTIVHGGDLILNKAYPVKFRMDVQRRLQARGVRLLLGDIAPVDALFNTKITTRNGQILTPDLVIPCRGPRPRTMLLEAAFGADSLTAEGYAKILGTFQLPNHPKIFACGDIADLTEQRQIGKYGGHASVITKNVLALLDGKEPAETYKGGKEMIAITIGKAGGASYLDILWGICLGNWFTAYFKSRKLLVPLVRSFLGL